MTSSATRPSKESQSARAARKNRLLTWITLAIAAVICAVIGVGAYAMNNSWWTEESPIAAADQQLPDGQSRFDQAGQDFFNRQGRVTVDVASAAPASDLGLPFTGTTVVDTLVPLTIDVRGADGAELSFGGVSRFHLVTVDDGLVTLVVVPPSSGAWTSISADVSARAAGWGWSDADIATLTDEVGAAIRAGGGPTVLSLPTVSPAGLTVTARVTVTSGSALGLEYILTR